MTKNTITKDQLVKDLRNLGVKEGDLLNVKCSLKSIGYVEGGVATLIEALLNVVGTTGTIVTDSFINVYRKGIAHKKPTSNSTSPSYAGALANAMIKHPLAHRSKHPVQKFVAIGALAEELTKNHTPESYGYDVLRVMCTKGGKNLKIGSDEKVVGVGTTHVAIGILGYKQIRPVAGVYYENEEGESVFFERNWAGICSDGLIKFIPFYADAGAILSMGQIGNAEAKITDMKRTLEVELNILKNDPTFFMCNHEDCIECQLTWEFSKKNKIPLFFRYLLSGKIRNSLLVLRYILFNHKMYPEKKIELL